MDQRTPADTTALPVDRVLSRDGRSEKHKAEESAVEHLERAGDAGQLVFAPPFRPWLIYGTATSSGGPSTASRRIMAGSHLCGIHPSTAAMLQGEHEAEGGYCSECCADHVRVE